MRLRVFGAIALLPWVVAGVWLGEPWFSAFIALTAALGAREFYLLARHAGGRPWLLAGVAGAVLFAVRPRLQEPSLASILLLALALSSLLWLYLRSRSRAGLEDGAWTLVGMGYVGWPLSRLVLLRGLPQGRDWVFLALFTTFALDTVAYAVGRLWGRRPLAPRVSPRKTWEGALGGLAGAAAAALALGVLFDLPASPLHFLALGLLAGVAGQVGDLAQSWLKRRAGVKDSGRLIPGHGGALDRLDSLLFTSFVIYYYVDWILT